MHEDIKAASKSTILGKASGEVWSFLENFRAGYRTVKVKYVLHAVPVMSD